MLKLSTNNVLTAASIAGVAFIGYSIYFDQKRRSAPDYKQKIREKRKLKQLSKDTSDLPEFPDPHDRSAMEHFLFSELTLGEDLMNSGEIEKGAMHMSNAIIVSDHSKEFLSIFKQTLPPALYLKVVQALPGAKIRFEKSIKNLYSPRIVDVSDTPENYELLKKNPFVMEDDLE